MPIFPLHPPLPRPMAPQPLMMNVANTPKTPIRSAGGSWFLVCMYCGWETLALLLSTLYSFAQPVIQERYDVTDMQVVTMGQSMQILGNMFGVALLSPVSDVFGRKRVTVCSMLLYAAFSLGAAFSPNFPTLVFFMFMSGVAWSTSLSLVPAVFSDLYLHRNDIGQPIALFVIGASVGPTLGGVVATALSDAGAEFKWYFLVAAFASTAAVGPMLLVEETLQPDDMPTARKGQALRRSPNRSDGLRIATKVWTLLLSEPVIWITGLYNGLANGIFVLTVSGSITTLTDFKGLPLMDAASSVIFMALGVILVWFIMPLQTRAYQEDKTRHLGRALPESRLILVHDVLWLFPVALFWSGLTGDAQYSKWHQAVTGGLVAFSDSFLYQCLLIYILDLYPADAASAAAAWLIPCFPIQAATVHFGSSMFIKLGPRVAFVLLGLFTSGFVVPGFYAIQRWGPQMRQRSPKAKRGFRM